MIDVIIAYTLTFSIYFIGMHLRNKEFNKYNARSRPLPDAGHKFFNIKRWRWTYAIADIMPFICIANVVLDGYINGSNPQQIREYCLLHATMYFVRTISIHLTTLPTPVPGARYKNAIPRSYGGLVPSYNNDLMFSGHTSTCLLALYIVHEYYLLWICVGATIVCALTLIASREHYTMDVFLALIASQALYSVKEHILFWVEWAYTHDLFNIVLQ